MTTSVDAGLLVLRVGVGGALAAHGAQKLFGWFGGGGLDGTSAMFDKAGFRPARASAVAAGITEAGGGILLAAGTATPAAGAAIAGTMVVASSMLAPNGFFAQKGGYEYAALLGLAGLSLAVTGPGSLSGDHLTGDRLNRPWMRAVAVLAVVPAAAAVIGRRRRALAVEAQAAAEGSAGEAGAE